MLCVLLLHQPAPCSCLRYWNSGEIPKTSVSQVCGSSHQGEKKKKRSTIFFASSPSSLWGRNSVWPPGAVLCCWGVRESTVLTCVKGEARWWCCLRRYSWVLWCEKGWPVLGWLAKAPSLFHGRPEPAPHSKHSTPCSQLLLIREFTRLLVRGELGV